MKNKIPAARQPGSLVVGEAPTSEATRSWIGGCAFGDRLVPHQLHQEALDRQLAFGIEGGGGFIEHGDRGFLEEGAGNADPLPLAMASDPVVMLTEGSATMLPASGSTSRTASAPAMKARTS